MAYNYTREEMEAIIMDGRSIMVDGKIVTNISELPALENFVSTEEEKTKTLDDIHAAIETLNAQLSAVKSKKVVDTSEVKFDLNKGKTEETK